MKTLKLNPWLHLFLTVLLFGLGIVAMQNNSQRVREMREQIVALDQSGDDAKVDQLIIELSSFVRTHTNTKLRAANNFNEAPIQLIGRYERAVKAANEAVAKNPAFDNKLYLSALSECSKSGVASYSVVALCIEQFLRTRAGSSDAPNVPVLPRKELYTYDFASPTIGPDLPGFMIVASGLLFVWWVIRFVLMRIRRYLNT